MTRNVPIDIHLAVLWYIIIRHELCHTFSGPAERFEKWGGPIGKLKLRGSEATKPEGAKLPRGGGCGRGCPPSHGRELFHFPT